MAMRLRLQPGFDFLRLFIQIIKTINKQPQWHFCNNVSISRVHLLFQISIIFNAANGNNEKPHRAIIQPIAIPWARFQSNQVIPYFGWRAPESRGRRHFSYVSFLKGKSRVFGLFFRWYEAAYRDWVESETKKIILTPEDCLSWQWIRWCYT